MTSSETTTPPAKLETALGADSLADSVVILLGLSILQRLVGFLRSILFCRWLDPAELGHWDMAFGFLLTAAPLAVLGLPGSFGRYVEHYRQRRQLRPFLRRTTFCTSLLGLLAVLVVWLASPWLSRLVFGSPDRTGLAALVATALGVVIAQNFLISLFTALRMYRVVSGMQLVNSLVFALLALGLLRICELRAEMIVIAFGCACLVTSCGSLVWLRRVWRSLPLGASLPQRALWGRLLPFAIWFWTTNCLSNLFEVVDRYMIIHCGGMEPGAALDRIGQYHSASLVPLLFVSIAELFAAMITPHLTHDWEAGRRDAVARRLNLTLKLLAFGLSAAAVMVLLGSPLLFEAAFQGKYPGGPTILPWILSYSIWGGLAIVAQNYLWCAEKARLGSLTLVVGLVTNVGLNLLLLPRLGLLGAVLATTAAYAVVLVLVYAFAWRQGMRWDRSTWLVAAAPALLWLGPWAALAALAGIGLAAAAGNRLLGQDEKRLLADVARQYCQRLGAMARPNRSTLLRRG